MNTQELIAEYFAKGGTVTVCPPAAAKSNEQSKSTARHIATLRREWRKENK